MLGVTALSVVCCVVFEYLIQRFMLRGAPTVGNLSAVVTGVLLAFNLPASIPWWIVVIGAFVAIAIGKSAEGMSRQPEASGSIRSSMMLGLVFIETAIIYALIVAILIIFVL